MDKVDRLIEKIRYLKEEGIVTTSSPANNASSGAIAGFPPDSPPVNIDLRKGRRRNWNPFFKNLVGMFRRKDKKIKSKKK